MSRFDLLRRVPNAMLSPMEAFAVCAEASMCSWPMSSEELTVEEIPLRSKACVTGPTEVWV